MTEVRFSTLTYLYRAELVRVIDGDTVVLKLDLGFRMSAELPIRLNGLNTPELHDPQGKLVKAWVVAWFAAHPVVWVETQRNPEKYGRWLGEIYGVADKVSLNAALLAGGLARPWDGQGVRPV